MMPSASTQISAVSTPTICEMWERPPAMLVTMLFDWVASTLRTWILILLQTSSGV